MFFGAWLGLRPALSGDVGGTMDLDLSPRQRPPLRGVWPGLPLKLALAFTLGLAFGFLALAWLARFFPSLSLA